MVSSIGAGWFLWNLYLVICIFIVFNIIKLSYRIKVILCVCLFLIGYIFYKYHFPHYFGFVRIPLTLGFYIFGHLLKLKYRRIINIIKEKKGIFILSIIISFVLYYLCGIRFNSFTDMIVYRCGFYPFYIVSSITGSYLLFLLAYSLRNIQYLQEYGQNTLFTLCTHLFILYILKLLFNYFNCNIIISSIIIFLIILLIPNYICKYLDRYCPILLGKVR